MNFLSAWLLLFGVSLAQAADTPGIKMTIEYGPPRNGSRRTIYFQADRKRFAYQNSFGQQQADGSVKPIYGPHLVSITRCDLGQAFELNLDTREYTSAPFPPKPFTKEEMEKRGMRSRLPYVSDKPTLRIETTTTDTGERKEIFGQTARHVITTRKQTPLEGSVSQGQESVTDGWYIDSKTVDSDIDLYQRLSCDRERPRGKKDHAYIRAVVGSQPLDRAEFVDVGEPETGFTVESVTTVKGAYRLHDGTEKQLDSKNEMRVIEIEKGPLDAALFEIPEGFKLVDHIEHNPPQSAFFSQSKNFWQQAWKSVADLLR
ncbi:MAG TPA: hypothetical protein VK828_08835 [Terriglobales bacterium]|jgi:hypothetical protein|nr:hypothetical protein [Terriglobales bacterium]